MANIKISTQTSTATAPPKANYGDLWVGKDGSFYATNQNGDAIKMALKSEVTAVQNAAMPKTGGDFTGIVNFKSDVNFNYFPFAHTVSQKTGTFLRPIDVKTVSPTGTSVPTQGIIMVRK